ncbi:unnamed protein product [Dibothriocephalus latus]|uniref:Serine-threonine/tyrosine-protein kinase catalytic domain-containing protein n=1 Tax=Dibothriocephalus latus TaxID=60516 RepID=A0A3P7N9Z7_DIBLA|nr:unnamed protein product [Dibothriocephalus latus]
MLESFLNAGSRLENPALSGFTCSDKLYQLMYSCWNLDPNKRPPFKEIEIKLEEQIAGDGYDPELHERRED